MRYNPIMSFSMCFCFSFRGLATKWCTSLTSLFEIGCVGDSFHSDPAPNNLSIILHKDIGQGPLSKVRGGDPQRDECNNVPQWISDMHCHFLGPSVGHGALKVKQMVSMAGCIPLGVTCPLALLPRLPQPVPHHTHPNR